MKNPAPATNNERNGRYVMRKLLAVLTVLAMVAGTLPATAFTAFAEGEYQYSDNPYTYTEYSFDEETRELTSEEKTVSFDAPLTSLNSTLGSGSYYLKEDIEISSTLQIDSGEVYLDLNGYNITFIGTEGSVIKIANGAFLYLFDSSNGQTGTITGGKKGTSVGDIYRYGGAGVYNLGVFIMYGGNVSGNHASGNGGGVYNAGTLEMHGGGISNNKADNTFQKPGYYSGAGVGNDGSFKMYEGTIEKNTTISDGGGVCNGCKNTTGVSFKMYGGSIKSNQVNSGSYGGGIYNNTGAAFDMYGGTIESNSSTGRGGGVELYDGTFNMYDGIIRKNSVSSDRDYSSGHGGGGVSAYQGTFSMYDGTIEENTVSGKEGNGNGGGVLVRGATFNMNGGTIRKNKSSSSTSDGGNGGGVCIDYYGTVNMSGGTIEKNTSSSTGDGGNGGGIYIDYNIDVGTLNLSGMPIVRDNYKDTGIRSDVCLCNTYDNRIIITDRLEEGTEIGVHFEGGKVGTVTSGFGAHHSTDAEEVMKYFVANIVGNTVVDTNLTGTGNAQEIELKNAEHSWQINKAQGNSTNEYTIICTNEEAHNCDYKTAHGFIFDASECGGEFNPNGTSPATIYSNDNDRAWSYLRQTLSVKYTDGEGNSSNKPPRDVGEYTAKLMVADENGVAKESGFAIDFSITPINIDVTLKEPKGGENFGTFTGEFSNGSDGYILPDIVDSVSVEYKNVDDTEISGEEAEYDTNYKAEVTLKLKEGYPKDAVGSIAIKVDGEEKTLSSPEIAMNGDGTTVSTVKVIYEFTAAMKKIPVDKDGNGIVDEENVPAKNANKDGIYEANVDEDADIEKLIPVDMDGNEENGIDHYVSRDALEDKDGDGIYTPVDPSVMDGDGNIPEYIGKSADNDDEPEKFIKVTDENGDGIYEDEDGNIYLDVDTDGDGIVDKKNVPVKDTDGDDFYDANVDDDNEREKLIPVDLEGDGGIDHYVPEEVLIDAVEDKDKDGIYTPVNENGDPTTEPEYIGIDESGDDNPDKFIKVEDSDSNGIYGDDANKDDQYDGPANAGGKEDNRYIPDRDGDGLAESDTNGDGIFEGTKDDEEYIPVDKNGNENIEDNEIVKVTDDNGDGIYDDSDGNRYIPDQDGDGLAEPETDDDSAFEGTKKDENGDGKIYIPVDADADGDVDEFVEVKDIDGEYKDDDDGDDIFGGDGDYTYEPIDDDSDTKPDRYVTEDAVAEDGHAHTVGTPATCTEAAKCGVENCGEYYGKPLGHNYGDWRKVNGTKHERECEREGCEYAMEGNHSPELECGANAASCDICGATAAGDHTFSKEWSSDKTGHWKGCIHCGTKDPESVATHNYPNKNAGDGVSQTCETCGYGGHITRVTADDSFEDYYIPKTLKKQFPTVDAIKTAMKDKAKEGNSDLSDDEVWLFDAVLEYSIDGGITWKPASEDYFPKKADGTYDVLPVKLLVPEETNIADYEYKVYHMFTSNKFKEVGGPGYIEQPIVTEEKGDAECDRGYISFYVKGLSPIMVVWEKTASDTTGGGGSTGPEEGNRPEPRTIPDQDGDNKPEPDSNDDGIYEGTDDDKKYVKDEDGNIEEVTDPDGDGIYDGEDRDGDGKPDKRYIADQDGDGIPEPDTDGDGIFEGTKDDKRYGTGENDRRNKDNSDKKTYEFVDGKLIWIKGSTKDLTFTIDAPAKKFKKLIIGGETVGKGEYSYVSGSTIVTVDADYLNSLKLGSYEVKAVYTDGRAETTLKVKAAAGAATSGTDTGSGNSAGTGDESNLLLWMMIATAAAAGGVGTLIPRRRRSH